MKRPNWMTQLFSIDSQSPMTRLLFLAVPLSLNLVLLSMLAVSTMTFASECEICHSNQDFYAQDRKLYAYYQDWLTSPHQAAGLSCEDCHGGDPTAHDVQAAHHDIAPLMDTKSTLYYKNQPATCGTCHADKASEFKQSKHYEALMADSIAPTCTTCHRAMNRKPYYRDILLYGCRTCHNEQNVDRIPLVTGRAREILHRLNLAKAYLGWTTVYYQEQDWPGDAKQQVQAVSRRYDEAITKIHAFDLTEMDENSIEILTTLKLMFQNAWDEKQGMD